MLDWINRSILIEEWNMYSYRRIAELSAVTIPMENRRKSHWDYVLEEMVWLANDFAQERVWKMMAAAEMSHQVAFTARLRFQEQNSSWKLKKVAHSVAKDVMDFWQSVEGKSKKQELPIPRKNHDLAIIEYALRFLEYNGSNVPQKLAEAPLTPERVSDAGTMDASEEDHLREENLFYTVPLGAMDAYRKSIESHVVHCEATNARYGPPPLKPQMHAQTQQTQQRLPPTQTQIQFHPQVSRCQPCFSLTNSDKCPGCIIAKYISSSEELKLLSVRFTTAQLRRSLQFLEDSGSSYVVTRFWIEDACLAISEMKKVEEVEKELESLRAEVRKLKEDVEQLEPHTPASKRAQSAVRSSRVDTAVRKSRERRHADVSSVFDIEDSRQRRLRIQRGDVRTPDQFIGQDFEADEEDDKDGDDDAKDEDYVPLGWRRSARSKFRK